MKARLILLAACTAVMAACSAPAPVGVKTEALDASAWEGSQWISVADAPVVSGRASDIFFAADGASWFLSTVSNEKKVVSARHADLLEINLKAITTGYQY